jgi:hypothetical protein
MRCSSGPSASVSRWAMPEEGSSSRSTSGSWAIIMARSTMRRDPVDSSRTNLSRNAPRFMSSMRSATVHATSSSSRRTTGQGRATTRRGRGSPGGARARWRGSRRRSTTGRAGRPGTSAPDRGGRAATRAAGEVTSGAARCGRRPAAGTRTAGRTCVVLPAPFGPMSPRISPREGEVDVVHAVMPPKRFVTPSGLQDRRRARSTHPGSPPWPPPCPASGAGPSPGGPAAPARKTERTMSSRSSRSALGPSKRTSPFSRK